jgi:hypothetical protein
MLLFIYVLWEINVVVILYIQLLNESLYFPVIAAAEINCCVGTYELKGFSMGVSKEIVG